MEQLRFREVLPYSAKDLHDLVMDAERYGEFSSLIRQVHVAGRGPDTKYVEVLFETPAIPVAIRYACELQSIPPSTIRAKAVKSPFKAMSGEIKFKTLPNGHTEVDCLLEYRTGLSPIALIASGIMKTYISEGIEAAKQYLAQRLTPVGAPPPAPGI